MSPRPSDPRTTYTCQDCESGPCYYTVTFKNPEPPDVCGYVEEEHLVQLVSWVESRGRGRAREGG